MARQFDWAIIPNVLTETRVHPRPTHTYDLYNLTDHECLVYGERTWGINLRWGDPAKGDNVRFMRQGGAPGPLKFGELVAIAIRNGSFLRYQSDRVGINLGWSDTPKFEWILKGGTDGQEVPTGRQVGLYSMVEHDFLMYEPRDWGVNLKWFKDSGKYDTLTEVFKEAQTIEGYAEKVKEVAGLAALVG